MDLTVEEENILDGDPSDARTRAMGILVNYGEIQEADRLIPIRSAHVSGVSYLTAGEALLVFLKDLVEGGGRATVPSSLNPAGMDLDGWMEMGIPSEFAGKQLRIIDLFSRLGIALNCSCIPYEIGDGVEPIERGDHLAWGESNAVIYANSMVGARTNREGGISTVASAIIGKTPNWGMHVTGNRYPTLKVKVNGKMTPFHYDLLGAYVGVNHNSDIALFEGIHPESIDLLKHLGAALASKGGHALYHIPGITAEQDIVKEADPGERLDLTVADLDRARDEIYPESSEGIDAFVLGCPQFGPSEFRRLSNALGNRKLAEGKRVLVFTSRDIRERIDPHHIARILNAGVEIYNDTCMVVTPLASMGLKKVGTDSAKAAHYIPKLPKVKAAILPIEIIADMATR